MLLRNRGTGIMAPKVERILNFTQGTNSINLVYLVKLKKLRVDFSYEQLSGGEVITGTWRFRRSSYSHSRRRAGRTAKYVALSEDGIKGDDNGENMLA